MKSLNYLFLLLFSTSFLFTSCTKEEDPQPQDIRESAIGTYDYTMKLYALSAGNAQYLGSQLDETGTIDIKKNDQNATTIDFFQGGTREFQGNKIAIAGNGFTFDIPEQSYDIGGESYTVSGYNYWEVESTKYNGFYDSEKKKVWTAFTTTIQGMEFLFLLEGTKLEHH